MIYGKWTECLWGLDPAAYESFKKQERRTDSLRKTKLVSGSVRHPPRVGWVGGAWPGLPLAGDAVPLWPQLQRVNHRTYLSSKAACLLILDGGGVHLRPNRASTRPEPGGIRGHLRFLLDTSFFLATLRGMWDLVPGPGIEPGPLQWEHRVLTTGPPGKSLFWILLHKSPVSLHLVCLDPLNKQVDVTSAFLVLSTR